MSAWISSAAFCHSPRGVGVLAQPGQPRPAVRRDPAHHLRRGEVLRLAAHLPDAAVRLAPVLERVLDLMLGHLPDPVIEPVPRPCVQVQGVEHRAPHVVLPLAVRGVADPDRPGALVSLQVLEHELVDVAPAVDAVDDLDVAAVALDHVGEEREVVAGLPLEAEREQAPERERRVPDPAVAVVPVPLAPRRLRQRCGRRGSDRAGRGEREALERERAAAEVRAPPVIGEVAPGQPVLPVMGGPGHPLVGVLVALRRLPAAPGQGHEAAVALAQQRAGPRARTLEADPDV